MSPAQLLGQEKSAGSSTDAGSISLEKSRALQEMWCPQEFLGWCSWRLWLCKHLECPEHGNEGLCCRNRLKCQCWLKTQRWPHKHRAGFPGQAPAWSRLLQCSVVPDFVEQFPQGMARQQAISSCLRCTASYLLINSHT